jgi:hypothetical protein
MSVFLARKNQETRQRKAEAWQVIKARSPDTAEVMSLLAKVFGPLRYVRVVFLDGTVVEVGDK